MDASSQDTQSRPMLVMDFHQIKSETLVDWVQEAMISNQLNSKFCRQELGAWTITRMSRRVAKFWEDRSSFSHATYESFKKAHCAQKRATLEIGQAQNNIRKTTSIIKIKKSGRNVVEALRHLMKLHGREYNIPTVKSLICDLVETSRCLLLALGTPFALDRAQTLADMTRQQLANENYNRELGAISGNMVDFHARLSTSRIETKGFYSAFPGILLKVEARISWSDDPLAGPSREVLNVNEYSYVFQSSPPFV